MLVYKHDLLTAQKHKSLSTMSRDGMMYEQNLD